MKPSILILTLLVSLCACSAHAQTSRLIANVPDIDQPPNNPLNWSSIGGFCAPTSGANITAYWDRVMGNAQATNVNAGLPDKTAAAYIGWCMDTNNLGSPIRDNGNSKPPSNNGTYVSDIGPGLAHYARWDTQNNYGVSPPPTLPANPNPKNGYSWTIDTKHNTNFTKAQAWTQIVNEITAGRPLILCWCYWNPVYYNRATTVNGETVHFYTWGDVETSSSDPEEEWNDTNPNNPQGDMGVGHATTAVGYLQSYDPDGSGGLPATDWVIVHDNWSSTNRNVAIPWKQDPSDPNSWIPWSANTTVNLTAPPVGILTVSGGPRNFPVHFCDLGQTHVLSQVRLSASSYENIDIVAVTLEARGGGNDQTDITSVALIDDLNSNGLDDIEPLLGQGSYGADNGTINIPCTGLTINANSSKDVLVRYSISPTAANGADFAFDIPAVFGAGQTSYNVFFVPVDLSGLPFKGGVVWTPFLASPGSLSRWKGDPDGAFGQIPPGYIIMCSSAPAETDNGGYELYIQDPTCASGIRVFFEEFPTEPLPPGARMEMQAGIATENGERVLVEPTILGVIPGNPPEPVMMSNAAIGGADWLYNPITGAGQKGILEAKGLNNIGLLIKTVGNVIDIGPDCYYITDGSPLLGLEPNGIKVNIPLGGAMPTINSKVSVTGISSCEMMGPELRRIIKSVGDFELLTQ